MSTTAGLMALVAGIIGLGVGSQLLADRFQVPSIVFLLAAGVALGPGSSAVGTAILGREYPGLITVETFGEGLPVIVGLAVAIIVFEGAFHLRLERLREAPSATLRLVTLGAVIALVGTAAAVELALEPGWDVAFLIGALLVATGPTVITPILAVVPVRDRVGTALETEGIVNDVTAAILAVVIFKAIRVGVEGPTELLTLFVTKLGTGIGVGALVAGVVVSLMRYVRLSPENAARNARLLTLAGALVAYGGAEFLVTEAGIAAVAAAGVLLGNLDLPYEADITEFKGDITLVVLSFVFIALAALLDIGNLIALGYGGIAVVAAVLALRPLLVFLSTVGAPLTKGERLFISFVGPRGIIPASVATLFAIQLRTDGLTAQADVIVGTVFLVIFVTVLLQAGLARPLAAKLDVIPMRVIIVGGGQVGRTLAERLEDRGENVVIVESDEDNLETARQKGFTVVSGDGTDTDVLREAGAENAKIVVAATGDDDVNLLVSQLAKSTFDPETVLASANRSDNVDAFEELGVKTVAPAFATAQELDDLIERPALASWITAAEQGGDVQEVEVTAEKLIGDREAVREAMDWLHPK